MSIDSVSSLSMSMYEFVSSCQIKSMSVMLSKTISKLCPIYRPIWEKCPHALDIFPRFWRLRAIVPCIQIHIWLTFPIAVFWGGSKFFHLACWDFPWAVGHHDSEPISWSIYNALFVDLISYRVVIAMENIYFLFISEMHDQNWLCIKYPYEACPPSAGSSTSRPNCANWFFRWASTLHE